jgi:hypothetical protein
MGTRSSTASATTHGSLGVLGRPGSQRTGKCDGPTANNATERAEPDRTPRWKADTGIDEINMASNLEQAEDFAELFHHYYKALAPDFGCPQSQTEWEMLPINERQGLVAATRLALLESRSYPEWHQQRQNPFVQGTEGRECGC